MISSGDTEPQENYQKPPEILGALLLLSTTSRSVLLLKLLQLTYEQIALLSEDQPWYVVATIDDATPPTLVRTRHRIQSAFQHSCPLRHRRLDLENLSFVGSDSISFV